MTMVFDYSKLRGKIKEVYGTEKAFAKELGIGRVTLNMRLNNHREFNSSEITQAVKLLGIRQYEIHDYFFTQKVRKSEREEAM